MFVIVRARVALVLRFVVSVVSRRAPFTIVQSPLLQSTDGLCLDFYLQSLKRAKMGERQFVRLRPVFNRKSQTQSEKRPTRERARRLETGTRRYGSQSKKRGPLTEAS